MPRPTFIDEQRTVYPVRMAGSTILALLVTIAAFRFWPPPDQADERVFDARAQETITAEEILPTTQQTLRPPPPAPVMPVVVPDDVVLTDVELELADQLQTFDPAPIGNETPTQAARPGAVRPDAGPRPVRFSEPEYTREAQRRKIRAEVIVEVLVDERGRVQEAQVVERYLVDGRDPVTRQPVEVIGYGLEESAVAAARQCMFRPARQDGQAVRSFTTLTFSFGL